MPKVEAGTVPNAGHILAMQQPAEVNRRILDFLQA
jgi:pimeloyl-ACP methyl ester carboxylesterase